MSETLATHWSAFFLMKEFYVIRYLVECFILET